MNQSKVQKKFRKINNLPFLQQGADPVPHDHATQPTPQVMVNSVPQGMTGHHSNVHSGSTSNY